MLAARVYLGRFERLFEDHTIFAGVTYTDAHVTLTGMLVVCDRARRSARLIALVNAVVGAARRAGWCWRSRRPRSATSSPASLGWYVTQLHRQAERAGARAPVHHAQHRDDAAGVRARPHRAAARSPPRAASRRSTPRNNQDDAAEHPAVGLARAAGHAAADPGDPHLLRLPRHRHRSLRDRRHGAADDARRARAERREAAREQPQLDQREADLHARLRRHDEPGQRLHARRAADADPEQHAGPEHDSRRSR